MPVQGWLVVIAFVMVIALIVTRVHILRRRGIRAFLFGVSDRSDAIIPVIVLFCLYCLTTPFTGWPMWSPLITRLWSPVVTGWVGVVLCFGAVAALAWTLVSFGDSFRVGIDEQHPSGLVTTGIFARSRNPIYVCFGSFVLGMLLTQCNVIAIVVAIVFAAFIHRQVLREERFLAEHYGEEYESYRARVRRYV